MADGGVRGDEGPAAVTRDDLIAQTMKAQPGLCFERVVEIVDVMVAAGAVRVDPGTEAETIAKLREITLEVKRLDVAQQGKLTADGARMLVEGLREAGLKIARVEG
jgi:hypothetical protein